MSAENLTQIHAGSDTTYLQQALNALRAAGVNDLVPHPEAYASYGAPVGCVLKSPTHTFYPGARDWLATAKIRHSATVHSDFCSLLISLVISPSKI